MKSTRYWLFKSEPDVYSIDDLQREKDGTTCWDGVRNYQARNFLRDEVQPGDGVLFYHSSTDPAGVAGTAVVTRSGYPDHTQFEAGHPHFDPGAAQDSPRWFMVDISFVRRFNPLITLRQIRTQAALKDMSLLQKGSRLSIQPVTEKEWRCILEMAGSSR